MSVKSLAWAWEQEVNSPSVKLVLFALADHADDDGICWPGVKHLAEKCEMSDRTIQRNLNKLEELGKLRIVKQRRPDGSPGVNKYILAIHTPGVMVSPPGDKLSPPSDTVSPPGDTNVTTSNNDLEPSLEPSIDPLSERTNQTGSQNKRTQILHRLEGYFGGEKAKRLADVPTRKLDLFLCLCERGEVEPSRIRSPKAYAAKLDDSCEFPPFVERYGPRRRSRAADDGGDGEALPPQVIAANARAFRETLR